MILAVDTSTDQASVAVRGSGEARGELSWIAQGNHSRTLEPAIKCLLELTDIQLRQISSIAVASGPGSFSGLRVGISAAKGLAFALGVPLVGVPTLDVVAFQASGWGRPVTALLPAGRGQVYAARYGGGTEQFHQAGEYAILSPAEAASYARGSRLAGEGIELLTTEGGNALETASAASMLRRASYLAELGERKLSSGAQDERDTLEPLYLRRSAAEEKRAAATSE